MLKALLALVAWLIHLIRSIWLLEAAGAALIVYGVYLRFDTWAAATVGGVALLLKAYVLEAGGSR